MNLKFQTAAICYGLALCVFVSREVDAASGEIYPQGDVFCFSFYSTQTEDSKYALEHGATAIGPFYSKQADHLTNAIAWNAKFIYKVEPPSLAGLTHADRDKTNFVWPSNETVSNEVAAIVNAVETNANIAIWDTEPEELRYYRPQEMNLLRVQYDAIRANDSSNRPICLYQQNNRFAAQLGMTMTSQDLCVKGTYVNTITDDLGKSCITNRIWARWSMQQAVDACLLYNTNAKPWIVLWMAGDPEPGGFDLIRSWCRHDAYLGLVMGGKGLFVWSGNRKRPGFSDRAFQSYFDGYLSVAHDLNGPLKLAPVFLFGTKDTNVVMTITAGPRQLELVYQNSTNSYPPATFLAIQHEGANYLFAVNSAEVPVTATFSGLPSTMRSDLFEGSDELTHNGNFQVVLSPLAVKGWRFTSATETLRASSRSSRSPPIGDTVTLK